MGFTQLESKKIVEACLRNVSRIAKAKESGEDRLEQIKLQLDLVDAVLRDTDKKKKKKSKKRKISDDDSVSIEIVEAVDPNK